MEVEKGSGGKRENKGSCGDGLGGVPDVGLGWDEGGSIEFGDAEIVAVKETLVGDDGVAFGLAVKGAAAHAVEGHLNHRVAGLPENGAILGVVGYPPNAGGGLDEGLVTVGVVLGHEVVDFGVLVEGVGDIGLAFGDSAIADVVVSVRETLAGDEPVAGVVGVGLGNGVAAVSGFDDGRAAVKGVGGVVELREDFTVGAVFDAC